MVALTPGEFGKWTPDQGRNDALRRYAQTLEPTREFQDLNETIRPEYDYGLKALQAGSKSAQINYNSSQNAAHNAAIESINQSLQNNANQFGGLLGNQGGGSNAKNPRLNALLRALRNQESGGDYGAINSDSGAMGAFQIMPSNFEGKGGWDKEALGYDISRSQFLESKKLQNRIAKYKFGQYLNKHGAKGALSAWYSGDPNKWNSKTPQGSYPSVRNYVLQVLSKLK